MDTLGIEQMLSALRTTAAQASGKAAESTPTAGGADFAQILQGSIDKVNQTQMQSDEMAQKLAADQAGFSQRFSQSGRDDLSDIDLSIGAGGAPILPGCCAWFECRNEIRYPGGDHLILVGLVEAFHRQEKLPLVFHRGRYRELK